MTMDETATDNMDTETTLLLRRDEEEELVQVEAAMERLGETIFGMCMAQKPFRVRHFQTCTHYVVQNTVI